MLTAQIKVNFFKIFFSFIYCRGQQRTPDPLQLLLQVTVRQCGYWEPNLDPLQKQQVCLTPEPSLQPLIFSL